MISLGQIGPYSILAILTIVTLYISQCTRGVYSGRLRNSSDFKIMWRPQYLREILKTIVQKSLLIHESFLLIVLKKKQLTINIC